MRLWPRGYKRTYSDNTVIRQGGQRAYETSPLGVIRRTEPKTHVEYVIGRKDIDGNPVMLFSQSTTDNIAVAQNRLERERLEGNWGSRIGELFIIKRTVTEWEIA